MPNNSGPKSSWQRLKKRSDFQKVSKQGQAIKLPALVFLYAPSSQTSPGHEHTNRAGFTATKRSVGNAVQRNRAKRRMRALAQKVLASATPPAGTQLADVVFIARKYALAHDFSKMESELRAALEKEGFTFAENKP